MFKTSVQEIGSILFLHDREDVKSCGWDLRICSSAEANTTSAETRQPGCEALLLTSAWSRVPDIAFPSAQVCMRPPPHWHGRAPASWRWCIRFVRSACNVRQNTSRGRWCAERASCCFCSAIIRRSCARGALPCPARLAAIRQCCKGELQTLRQVLCPCYPCPGQVQEKRLSR